MDDRVEAPGLSPLAHDEGAHVVERPLSPDQLSGHHLLRGPEAEEGSEEPRGCRSRDPVPVRETRHPATGAGTSGRRRGRRGAGQRLGRDDVQGQARGTRHHLLLFLRGGPRASRPRAQVPRLRRPLQRQFLRGLEQRGLQRRLVRLRAAGRAMPDGAVHVLPDQCSGHGTVRTHADHRGPGRVCELPRRMHGADPGHESASCRGRRTDRPRRCGDQVFHDPELVPRRQAGEGRDLQLRHEAGEVPRRELEDLVDPGRDGFLDYLEIPELHPAGRQLRR